MAEIGLLAAKLLIPPIASWAINKGLANFKEIPARKISDAKVSDFGEWKRILATVETHGVQDEANAGNRQSARRSKHDRFLKDAEERVRGYLLEMIKAYSESERLFGKAKMMKPATKPLGEDDEVEPTRPLSMDDVADLLVFEAKAKEHRENAGRYAALIKLTRAETNLDFAAFDRDVDTIFGCDMDDLSRRATILLLQYSVIVVKDQELESRGFLIKAIASTNGVVRNNYFSRIYKDHWLRELMLDLMCIQAWRDMPGQYMPWTKAYKGFCVRPTTYSAKVQRLLLFRTLRHVAFLLESMSSRFSEGLLDQSLAVNRFERSLLWETTCEITDKKGNVPTTTLADHAYDGEFEYPRTTHNGEIYMTELEKRRISKGCGLFTAMERTSVELIVGAAGMLDYWLSRKKNLQARASLGELRDFMNLCDQFSKCSVVARDSTSKKKRHLNMQSYTDRVAELCGGCPRLSLSKRGCFRSERSKTAKYYCAAEEKDWRARDNRVIASEAPCVERFQN